MDSTRRFSFCEILRSSSLTFIAVEPLNGWCLQGVQLFSKVNSGEEMFLGIVFIVLLLED